MARDTSMAKIKLEKGVPVVGYSREPKYPWHDMKVGDSFLVDGTMEAGVRGSARAFKNRHPGWNCKVRKTENGVRVWRIS